MSMDWPTVLLYVVPLASAVVTGLFTLAGAWTPIRASALARRRVITQLRLHSLEAGAALHFIGREPWASRLFSPFTPSRSTSDGESETSRETGGDSGLGWLVAEFSVPTTFPGIVAGLDKWVYNQPLTAPGSDLLVLAIWMLVLDVLALTVLRHYLLVGVAHSVPRQTRSREASAPYAAMSAIVVGSILGLSFSVIVMTLTVAVPLSLAQLEATIVGVIFVVYLTCLTVVTVVRSHVDAEQLAYKIGVQPEQRPAVKVTLREGPSSSSCEIQATILDIGTSLVLARTDGFTETVPWDHLLRVAFGPRSTAGSPS